MHPCNLQPTSLLASPEFHPSGMKGEANELAIKAFFSTAREKKTLNLKSPGKWWLTSWQCDAEFAHRSMNCFLVDSISLPTQNTLDRKTCKEKSTSHVGSHTWYRQAWKLASEHVAAAGDTLIFCLFLAVVVHTFTSFYFWQNLWACWLVLFVHPTFLFKRGDIVRCGLHYFTLKWICYTFVPTFKCNALIHCSGKLDYLHHETKEFDNVGANEFLGQRAVKSLRKYRGLFHGHNFGSSLNLLDNFWKRPTTTFPDFLSSVIFNFTAILRWLRACGRS